MMHENTQKHVGLSLECSGFSEFKELEDLWYGGRGGATVHVTILFHHQVGREGGGWVSCTSLPNRT